MRRPLFLLLLALPACAGGGSRVGSPVGDVAAPTRIETERGTVELRTTRADPTATFAIAAPPQRVWQALGSVYTTLDVPVTTMASRTRTLGNERLSVRRQLGGVALSRYLRCGGSRDVPNADTYQVTMRLLTEVDSADDGTSVLRTLVDGTARPVSLSGHPVTCASTGALERRIVAMLREQVAG